MSENINDDWQTVIGLEVHAQLITKSKIFSGASTAFGAEPNTQACAIDLGLPGVLPVVNLEAVVMAVKFGLAINANIATKSVFDRKNYFYPDLPKGYQISQFTHPIVTNGTLTIVANNTSKVIRINRAHLEEDAGKSLHEDFHGYTGIDLNRAGTPLLEIVTEPDLSSSEEAVAYLKTLHSLVKYIDICDGNMQEGSFRCDANVSVKRKSDLKLGTRVEIKNLNSFKFIEKAIKYEIDRQIKAITNGSIILQETRLYDVNENVTRVMRSKEEANDYRYFPDPDLLPICLSNDFIDDIKKSLPELAPQKASRFKDQYGLSDYEANLLTSSRDLSLFFEETIQFNASEPQLARLTAKWIAGELLAALNKYDLEINNSPITPKILATLVARIADNTISGKIAKQIFEIAWNSPEDPDEIIKKYDLVQVTDHSIIEQLIDQIIANFPKQVAEYKNGKEQLFGFFVGQVMKTNNKSNPELVNQLLKKKLK